LYDVAASTAHGKHFIEAIFSVLPAWLANFACDLFHYPSVWPFGTAWIGFVARYVLLLLFIFFCVRRWFIWRWHYFEATLSPTDDDAAGLYRRVRNKMVFAMIGLSIAGGCVLYYYSRAFSPHAQVHSGTPIASAAASTP
jgi:hypothetical protein